VANEVEDLPPARPRTRRAAGWTALGRTRVTGFALVVVLLVLWELSVRLGWVHSRNWPSFSAILVATWHGLVSGELSLVLVGTLVRMAVGFAIGGALGIAFGLCLASFRTLDRLVTPLIESVRPLPIPALIPPLILFLGLGDALKIFAVALSSFFPVFVNTFGGVRSVDGVLIQTARTFGTGPIRTLVKVVLPAALPSIMAGLRTSLALALIVAVVAEMIAGSSGIGYYIILTQYALKADAMYGAILCLAVVGYAMNRGFVTFERRLLPWYRTQDRHA
jgi:ABC-type nitrate/sulfonate/bicarbonate transport system permease component